MAAESPELAEGFDDASLNRLEEGPSRMRKQRPGDTATARLDVPAKKPAPVSAREIETLRLLGSGLAPKQIAGQLGISDSAVRQSLRSICKKIGSPSSRAAVPHAIKLGLLDPALL